MGPGGNQANVLNRGQAQASLQAAVIECSPKHSPTRAFKRGSGSIALALEY